MSKYDPLRTFLENAEPGMQEMTLTFQQVESILGFALPPSARQHRAWWANPSTTVDQHSEWVRFRRQKTGLHREA